MNFKKKMFYRKTKTKELKPKDGYSRFEFMGKVFRYLEQDVHIVRYTLLGNPIYGVYARSDDGRLHEVEFVYHKKGKYVPFLIDEYDGMI